MKNYEVTLLLVVNPSRDLEEKPELKRVEFNIYANSENEARVKAKELETSGLSVWESWADEVEEQRQEFDDSHELDKVMNKMIEDPIFEKIEKYEEKIQIQQELTDLLYSQVIDLTTMSKIELGDDVIKEIHRLRNLLKAYDKQDI